MNAWKRFMKWMSFKEDPLLAFVSHHHRILTKSEIFAPDQIAKIEEKHEAKYVCETCIKNKGGWVNSAVAIFYQPDPARVPEGGSQWFGMYWARDHGLHYGLPDVPARLMICNAITAVEQDITGISAENGDIIYSRYRHDYRWSKDKTVMIDGGRDYDRHNLGGPLVTLRIMEDRLIVLRLGGAA